MEQEGAAAVNVDGPVLRLSDLFAASAILAVGSLLLLVSLFSYSSRAWPVVLVLPAVFLHFLGWAALAGLLLDFEGGIPEDPPRVRKKGLLFVSMWLAFAVGLVLLALFYPEPTTSLPGWQFMVVSFLFPFIPAVYVPVLLVHFAIFVWKVRDLPGLEQRVVAGIGAFTLPGIVGLGMGAQLLDPEGFLFFLPVAGFTVVSYSLMALGWGLAFREESLARRTK